MTPGGAARVHRRKQRHEVAPNPLQLNRIADFPECRDRRPDARDANRLLMSSSNLGLVSFLDDRWAVMPWINGMSSRATLRLRHRMISGLESPSAVRRAT